MTGNPRLKNGRATTPIPLIHLAGEKHRQVVVDREKDVYLGHPTTVLLEDQKTMICIYPAMAVDGS